MIRGNAKMQYIFPTLRSCKLLDSFLMKKIWLSYTANTLAADARTIEAAMLWRKVVLANWLGISQPKHQSGFRRATEERSQVDNFVIQCISLNSTAPRRCNCNLKYSNSYHGWLSWVFLVKSPAVECHKISLVTGQYWSRQWLVAIRQQTWANVDPDLCRHLASLDHNDF